MKKFLVVMLALVMVLGLASSAWASSAPAADWTATPDEVFVTQNASSGTIAVEVEITNPTSGQEYTLSTDGAGTFTGDSDNSDGSPFDLTDTYTIVAADIAAGSVKFTVAGDGLTDEVYEVDITKLALSSIKLSKGSWNQTMSGLSDKAAGASAAVPGKFDFAPKIPADVVGDLTVAVTLNDAGTTATVGTISFPAVATTETDRSLTISVGGNDYYEVKVIREAVQDTLKSATLGSKNCTVNASTITGAPTVTTKADASGIKLTLVPNDATATVKVAVASGNAAISPASKVGGGDFTLTLTTGTADIKLSVTVTPVAGDDKVYTMNIGRVNPDVGLLSLELYEKANKRTEIDLDPKFDSATTDYDAEISDDLETIYIYLEMVDTSASLKIDGSTIGTNSSGNKIRNGTDPYELEIDSKTKSFRISADGVNYDIDLVREGDAKDGDGLKNLYVSYTDESTSSKNQVTMMPEFDTGIATYHCFLPYSNSGDDVYIFGTPTKSSYTVEIDGDDSYDDIDDPWYELAEVEDGDSVTIKVYNGSKTVGTYKIEFHVAEKKSLSDNADLDEVYATNKTGSGSSSSNWSSKISASENKGDYTINVPSNTYKTVRLYAIADDSKKAYVFVNGVMTGSSNYVELSDLSTSKANKYEIVVVAEDCEEIETYTVTVNYGTGGDALLTGLNLYSGNSTVMLSPNFAAKSFNYSAFVANAVTSVNVRPASDGGNVLSVNNQVVNSGSNSSAIMLSEGINKVSVQAVSNDGKSRNTYMIQVYRQPASPRVIVSNQSVLLNNAPVSLKAYNINGNNFVMLRDFAQVMTNTGKRFDVTYNDSSRVFAITTNRAYSGTGEQAAMVNGATAVPTNQSMTIDGVSVNPVAYNINGNNFFMLRDLAILLDFDVTYNNATRAMMINTGSSYTGSL